MATCEFHSIAFIILLLFGNVILLVVATQQQQQQQHATTITHAIRMCNYNNNNNDSNKTPNSNNSENAINTAINENDFVELETRKTNCRNSSVTETSNGNGNGNGNANANTYTNDNEIRTTTSTTAARAEAAIAVARRTQINDKRVQAETEMPASNALDYGLNMTTVATPSSHATATSNPPAAPATPSDETVAPMKLLSRKRRYLIFPDGSSFQVVYDGIYGIVDYTNYLILGITVALAWELPTEMPSELLETVQGRLANGTLGLTRRKDDNAGNIKYTDIHQRQQQQQQQQPLQFQSKPQYINAQTFNALPTNTRYYTSGSNSNNNNYYNKKWPMHFQVPMHQQYDFYYRHNNNNNNIKQNKHNDYYETNKQQRKSNMNRNGTGFGGKSRKRTYYDALQRSPFKYWQQEHRNPPHTRTKVPWWHLMRGLSPTFSKWQTSKAHATAGQRRLDYFANQQRQMQPLQQQQQQQQNIGYYQTNNAAATKTTTTGTFSATTNAKTAKTTSKTAKKVQKSKVRKHRIYPVFGKRRRRRRDITAQQQQQQQQQHQHHRHGIREARSDDELDKLDRLHIRHHRWTRHTLYGKIEKYLDRRGSHGQHCVRRALCETAQKSAVDRKPGTFVGEIMRALFTLPEALSDATDAEVREDRLLQHYDEAHAFDGDCAERYKYCQESLWTSQFIQ